MTDKNDLWLLAALVVCSLTAGGLIGYSGAKETLTKQAIAHDCATYDADLDFKWRKP